MVDDKTRHREFSAEFVRSQHRVFGFIASLLTNRSDAEEVFQQVCLVLWEKWDEFDPQRPFLAWACGIAWNVVRNHRRKSSGMPQLFDAQLLSQLVTTYSQNEPWLEARHQALSSCLDKLPSTQRALIERCYLRNESIIAASSALKLTPAALTMRLQRIRKALFDCVTRSVSLGSRA